MANTINANYQLYNKSTVPSGKRAPGMGKRNAASEAKNPFAQYGGSATVELSSAGLAALANQQKNMVDGADDNNGTAKPGEQKLSAKAQDYLNSLREQYGDYDFIVTDHIDDPKSLMGQGTKEYSVILTNEELEKMANDEDYAKEVMGKVDSAVDMAKRIEEKGELGEGVQFKHIAISFDNDGNMKLFAELEKMSEKQQERLEAAKEKRAEEKKEAEKAEEKEKEASSVKRVTVEASSEEELLEKLLGIDWDNVPAHSGKRTPHR